MDLTRMTISYFLQFIILCNNRTRWHRATSFGTAAHVQSTLRTCPNLDLYLLFPPSRSRNLRNRACAHLDRLCTRAPACPSCPTLYRSTSTDSYHDNNIQYYWRSGIQCAPTPTAFAYPNAIGLTTKLRRDSLETRTIRWHCDKWDFSVVKVAKHWIKKLSTVMDVAVSRFEIRNWQPL